MAATRHNSSCSEGIQVLISKILWKQELHHKNEIANSVLLSLFMTSNKMCNTDHAPLHRLKRSSIFKLLK